MDWNRIVIKELIQSFHGYQKFMTSSLLLKIKEWLKMLMKKDSAQKNQLQILVFHLIIKENNMAKISFLISFLILNAICFSQGLKKVSMYNDSIYFKVPSNWIYKPKYKTFSDYQIIYDGKYSNKSSNAALLLDVYHGRFGSDSITMTLLEYQKNERLSTKSPSTKYLTTGINKVGSIDVGYFTYTYLNRRRKLSYGTQLFFRIPNGKGVHVEIFNEADSVNKSKQIIDSIVVSLNFK